MCGTTTSSVLGRMMGQRTASQPDRRTQTRVPAGAGGTSLVKFQGDLSAGGRDGAEGSAGTSSIRQWAGVRREGSTGMASKDRSKDAIHQAWRSVLRTATARDSTANSGTFS
jgi:hypothetical protein